MSAGWWMAGSKGEDVKKQLLELTPENYLGYAGELAKGV